MGLLVVLVNNDPTGEEDNQVIAISSPDIFNLLLDSLSGYPCSLVQLDEHLSTLYMLLTVSLSTH